MVTRWLTVLIDLSHWVTPNRRCGVFIADLLTTFSVNYATVSRGELRGRFKLCSKGRIDCNLIECTRWHWVFSRGNTAASKMLTAAFRVSIFCILTLA
jgi:hypothetical protein